MLQDIFVGVMCVIVAGVAVWGWWIENGPDKSKPGDKEEKSQDKEADGAEKGKG